MKYENQIRVRWAAFIGLYALAVFVQARRAIHDSKLQHLEMLAFEDHDLDDDLVSLPGELPWDVVEPHLVALQDLAHYQMSDGTFVSWDATLAAYSKREGLSPDNRLVRALFLFVATQVEEDKAIAARMLANVKNSEIFNEFHVSAITEMLEGVVDAKETPAP